MHTETFKKIIWIQSKVQYEYFLRITEYMLSHEVSMSRDTFISASWEVWYEWWDSYCNYVSFLKFKYLRNKQWK